MSFGGQESQSRQASGCLEQDGGRTERQDLSNGAIDPPSHEQIPFLMIGVPSVEDVEAAVSDAEAEGKDDGLDCGHGFSVVAS